MRIKSPGKQAFSGGIPDPVYVQSDKFFNDPDSHKFFEDIGVEVEPVDVFGGRVPRDRTLAGLKKTEKAIQDRFQLGKPE